jgi:hypothetical protein
MRVTVWTVFFYRSHSVQHNYRILLGIYRYLDPALYVKTNATELSSSAEAAGLSTTQEFPQIMWNPIVHETLPLVSIPSQISSVNAISSCFCKNHFNIFFHPHTHKYFFFWLYIKILLAINFSPCILRSHPVTDINFPKCRCYLRNLTRLRSNEWGPPTFFLRLYSTTRDVGCSFPFIHPLARKIYTLQLLSMFPSQNRRSEIISENGCVLVFCMISLVLRWTHISWPRVLKQ